MEVGSEPQLQQLNHLNLTTIPQDDNHEEGGQGDPDISGSEGRGDVDSEKLSTNVYPWHETRRTNFVNSFALRVLGKEVVCQEEFLGTSGCLFSLQHFPEKVWYSDASLPSLPLRPLLLVDYNLHLPQNHPFLTPLGLELCVGDV